MVAVALAEGRPLGEVEGFTNHQGRGVAGVVEGHGVVAGRRSWLAEQWSQPAPQDLVAAAEAAEAAGQTPIWVGWDGAARAVLVVADTVKATSAEAVADLKVLGLHPVLLTGDNIRAARAVATSVGIEEVIAEVRRVRRSRSRRAT